MDDGKVQPLGAEGTRQEVGLSLQVTEVQCRLMDPSECRAGKNDTHK